MVTVLKGGGSVYFVIWSSIICTNIYFRQLFLGRYITKIKLKNNIFEAKFQSVFLDSQASIIFVTAYIISLVQLMSIRKWTMPKSICFIDITLRQ